MAMNSARGCKSDVLKAEDVPVLIGQIPLLIHSCNPDYQFYLRPHLVEGWDVVGYAVPRQRMAV